MEEMAKRFPSPLTAAFPSHAKVGIAILPRSVAVNAFDVPLIRCCLHILHCLPVVEHLQRPPIPRIVVVLLELASMCFL
jgi:hypothetical protein